VGAAVFPRTRLPRDTREQLIVKEAVRFFAEFGFGGRTRELARRLGVTQPLLYRYFPSIDRPITLAPVGRRAGAAAREAER
jgi:AcrR family transcriptional regulator